MPAFSFSATSPEGEKVRDRVDAASLSQARYILEIRRYTDVEFYTHDNADDIARMALAGTEVPPVAPDEWTAADDIGSLERRGLAAKLWWALKQHSIFLGPLLLWNFLSWRGDRPFGWGDWLGFVCSGLYLVIFTFLVMPMTIFEQLLEAAVWRDWAAQRRCIRLARLLRLVMRTGIPENELLFREANALAAGGNLSAALAHVAPLRGQAEIADYLFLSRVSTIHEFAQDYGGQLKCMEEAVVKKPDNAEAWIDLAAVRIRHFRNVAGARAALEQIADKELPELARAVLLLTSGIVSVEERDHAAAVTQLREAETVLNKFGNVLIQGFLAELQAYLALALAAQGKNAEARGRFERMKPLLIAQKADRLILRVDSAIGAG